MQRSMERTVLSGYIAGFAILCLVGYVAVGSIRTLIRDSDQVAHSYQTLQTIDAIFERLDDVANAATLFAEKNSSQEVEEYGKFQATVVGSIERLRPLVAKEPVQQQRLADIAAWLAQADEPTRAVMKQASPTPAALAELQARWNSPGYKAIVGLVSQMGADERASLLQRNAIAKQSADEALVTIVLAIVLAFVIAGAAATVTLRDLRARRVAEEQLAQARTEAEAANAAKSVFLANMSHEIRTPMTAILGYADLLLEPDKLPERHNAYLTTIRRNGQHLLAIINDILDLSKIEAGQLVIERIPCAPVAVLADIDSLMSVRATEKGIGLSFQFTTPIPEEIQTDPTRLRQILLNLVGNAIKFSDRGSVRVVVSSDRKEHTARLVFDIIDTGIGMTAEQLAGLFKPFSQADASTTRRFGGTGLGLNISQRLAKALGGDIAVESSTRTGSHFTLSLPLAEPLGRMLDPAKISLAAAAHGGTAPAAGVRWIGASVLVAEDGPDNRELIAAILARAGCRVVLATDGRDAVDRALAAAAAEASFDVILMDMQMPVMDGYEATAVLRARGYAAPIVALTAHAMDGDRQRCLQAGCTEYASKPIDAEDLLALIEKYAPRGVRADIDVKSLVAPELAARFLAGLPERMAALETALSNRNVDLVARLAHQLGGASGAYGQAQIGEEAIKLERMASDTARWAGLPQQLALLARACREAGETVTGASAGPD
jgi:signal transduction histidine kinase/DNA-binding response OmpR family regulator